jgi:hypothetical protein
MEDLGYFAKSDGKALGVETVSEPRIDEVVVFEDFFVAGLLMPLHLALVGILLKFQVQQHQLTSNMIVKLSKFFWDVMSCGGRPIVEVFVKHYELQYQQKKVKKSDDETLIAQFGCIMFDPNWYGDRAKLTPVMKNKWSSGWVKDWFYYRVPIHLSEAVCKGIHFLHSQMTSLDYLMELTHIYVEDDVNDRAFIRVTTNIGGHDVVEEYLVCGVWPLSATWDLSDVEEAEAPLLKVMVPLPKVFAMKGSKEKDHEFVMRVCVGANKLVGSYGLMEHQACMSQIRNGCLKHVFEVASVKYPPWLVAEGP